MSKKKNFSSNAGSNESTTPNKGFTNIFEGISCKDWVNKQAVDDAWPKVIDVYTDTDLFDVYKRPKGPEERAEEWQSWLEYVEAMDAEEEDIEQEAFEDRFKDREVIYFYEEVLDELRSLEEAKNHMIEDFNHREEMYKERASGIEFDYWVFNNF